MGFSIPTDKSHNILIAHAILGSLAWAVFFPLGAIIIRVLKHKQTLWIHAGWMVFTYLMALTSAALGIYLAVAYNKLDSAHAIIGLFIIAAFSFQPLTGLLHHWGWKKRHGPSFWTGAHVWWGRAIITLGAINGGLGFPLARPYPIYSKKGEIAYIVIAPVFWLLWMGSIALAAYRTRGLREGKGEDETGQKVWGGDIAEQDIGRTSESTKASVYGGDLEKTDAARSSSIV